MSLSNGLEQPIEASQDEKLFSLLRRAAEIEAELQAFLGSQAGPETEAQEVRRTLLHATQEALHLSEARAQELLEMNQRYRSLFINNHAVMLLIDPATADIVDANPAACSFYGYTQEELTRKKITDINTLTQAQVFDEMDHARVSDSNRFFFRHQLAGGEIRDVEVYSGPIVIEGKTLLYSIIHDITERKKAQEQVQSISRFPEENPNPVLRIALDGALLYANKASASFLEGWEKQLGEQVPDRWQEWVRQVLISKEAKDFEVPCAGRVYSCLITPIPEEGYANVYGKDITERRLAEQTLAGYASQLERSNRELQDFAFIASHDLQEPLRKIQAFSERLLSKYILDEEGRDYLARMHNAAGRMRTMITDLLAYSRVTTKTQPFSPVDLNRVIEEVIADLELSIEKTGGNVEIEPLPVIEADAVQMGQLLQNLVGNALKFHRPGVPPRVRVWAEDNLPGSYQIHVEDNGIGFEEIHLDRLFVPFQRLRGRSEYDGTGIGLAICRKIVERHAGQITARSTPGLGSTFIIELPTRQPTEPFDPDPTRA